jgi:hypothetical protein
MLSATLKCARSCAVISMSCLVKQRLSYATHIRSFPAPPNNDRDEELKEGDCAQPQQQAPPPSAPPFVSDDLSSRDAMHDASQVPPAARGKDDYTQVLQRAYALGAAAAAAGKPLPFGEAGAASDVAPLLGARRVEIIACGRSHMRAAPQWQMCAPLVLRVFCCVALFVFGRKTTADTTQLTHKRPSNTHTLPHSQNTLKNTAAASTRSKSGRTG